MNFRIAALDHLPVELLYEIHTLAASPSLPLTCKYLHRVFKSAPATVHADYLVSCCTRPATAAYSVSLREHGFISRVLRYPICTQDVLEAVLRHPRRPGLSDMDTKKRTGTVLPRRLFRNLTPRDGPGQPPWTDDDEPLPFLRYIYAHAHAAIAADSYDGYALTRAVYAGFTPLIRFLLEHGASPRCKGNIAVTVAIRRRSLRLVRLLIERDGPGGVGGGANANAGAKSRAQTEDQAGGSGGRGFKRRKLGDRVSVDAGMLQTAVECDARDIVEYFMHEKGCVPNMQTVLMMGR